MPGPTTTHTAALELHQHAISVIPTRADTSKAPATKWKIYTTERAPRAALTDWFAENHGLAIVTGRISGNLEMTEIEGKHAHHLQDLADLARNTGQAHLWERITLGWCEQSPSGGYHWIYRLTEPTPGNTKIARTATNEVMVETRGEGGYFIAAPTDGTHHTTGHPWARLSGGPDTMPTITPAEREAFHAILATIGEAPAPRMDVPIDLPATHDPLAGETPGDDFENKTTWAELLEPAGWQKCYQGHDGTIYWTRPGKDPRDGFSATTGRAADRDRLWVFSTSTVFETEVPYTKLGAYAVLHHDGDHSAAARALARQGFGKDSHVAIDITSIMPAARKDTTSWTSTPSTPTSSSPTPRDAEAPSSTSTAATTGTSGSTSTPSSAAGSASPVTSSPGPDGSGAPSSSTTTPAPTPAEVHVQEFTEYGNVVKLIAEHGQTIRYCHDRGRWLYWTGHVWEWQPKNGGAARQAVVDIAVRMSEDTATEKAWKKSSLSLRGVKATLELAETQPQLTVAFDDLDAHPWELNTPNGILDLSTGQLGPSDPARLHTRSTLVTPDPTADTTRWEEFLADTFPDNPDLIDYMQRLVGYSAVGKVEAHILPFTYGSGGNGKTVFLETIAKILGDYATSAQNGFLMSSNYKEHSTEIAALSGARMVLCSEVNESDRFDEAKVKLLTGGDTLRARFMRQDEFAFTPTHHLWLAGNYQPAVESGGESFWRRLRLIPFTHTVPEEKKVDDLQSILINGYGPAILAWIARGAADYHRNGLQEPEQVKAATEDYRESTDTVARFLEERCVLYPGNPNYLCQVRDFRKEYEAWCYEEGEVAVKGKTLATQLRRHDVLVGRNAPRVPNNSGRVYGGLRLASAEAQIEGERGRADLFG